jgi:hypothetical protein
MNRSDSTYTDVGSDGGVSHHRFCPLSLADRPSPAALPSLGGASLSLQEHAYVYLSICCIEGGGLCEGGGVGGLTWRIDADPSSQIHP